ncbi:uncharacterized protein BO66DRAFT_217485 [Aspergillus aculeatinus CBS 121060]|uniref:Uncharacterized protein n=1 Tax=Aspergillus aculeatinus CBS 121060 TaxID=1448322 RepID=A0ACD1GV76_9EURO|nr:hypothetical protein BO66DRAFT_217485 [Aspergillus aculeatinus CBS 121060]RAH65091.1 hypothetical protein BO66DRAFT_217485 [Aspergillus aculeatinus CBS 121060]
MEFPNLDGDPLIDTIIDRCWHHRYATVSELAAHTKALLNERRTDAMERNESRKEGSEGVTSVTTVFDDRWRTVMSRIINGIWGYGLGELWRRLLSLGFRREAATTERTGGDHGNAMDPKYSLGKEFSSQRQLCQDLEQRGLLRMLSSGEPEQIGFTCEWYRHSLLG